MFGAIAIPLVIVLALNLTPVAVNFIALSSGDPALASVVYLSPLMTGISIFISLFVIVWAGHRTTKRLQCSAVQAGIGGATIALISAVVVSILMFQMIMSIFTVQYQTLLMTEEQRAKYEETSPIGKFFETPTQNNVLDTAVGIGLIILFVFNTIMATLGGFVLGAIGSIAANRKQKTDFSTKK